jgi:hypothetical protein
MTVSYNLAYHLHRSTLALVCEGLTYVDVSLLVHLQPGSVRFQADVDRNVPMLHQI